MTPEAQQIAIAEAIGWTKCRLAIKGAGAPERGKSPYGVPPRRGYEVSLPNYTQDLNAMHEVEELFYAAADTLEGAERMRGYSKCLCRLAKYPLRATAAQRAEAFLRTIGRWEEEGQL